MNALPSLIVLDFCEWLKNQSSLQYNDNYIDMFDLILNEEYYNYLRQLASKYINGCCGGNYFTRAMLHSFIDSEEFEKCLRHFPPFNEDLYKEDFLDYYYNCFHLDKKLLEHFMNRYYDSNIRYNGHITPTMLVDSVRFYINHQQNDPSTLNLMTGLHSNLSLEIDFLEWLVLNKAKPMNLMKMPISLFKSIVDEYCRDVGRCSDDKTKLVKAFKQGDAILLGKKLVAVLTRAQVKKMKSLGYIFDRYTSNEIPFHCFFLPLASKADAFKKFIENNWIDLNSMSGDYLDIYYGEEDFGKSGYAIKDDMRMIPKYLPGELPCLVVWKNKLQYAQTIDIRGLSGEEVVRLIAKIVDLIKINKSFVTIMTEAKEMVNRINKGHTDALRPITENTFNIDNNTGIVTGYISDSNVTLYSGEVTNDEFDSETEKAVEIINSFTEIEKENRDILISLVKEANIAIQNRDDAKKLSCKYKFEGFMLGAGKTVDKIITKLSELATIASFFGLLIAKH